MRKLIGLFAIVLFSTLVWATAYTSSGTGDFNTNATWGGSGHPVSGDTFTIANGHNVTCSSTCVAGTAAATTCTTDGTVNNGGTLTIGDGASFTMRGILDVEHTGKLQVTATTTSATFTIQPGSAATCGIKAGNALGSGAAQFNATGTSTSILAIFSCDIATNSGTKCYIANAAGGIQPQLNLSYGEIFGYGNASNSVGNAGNLSYSAFDIENSLIMNCGALDMLGPADGTSNAILNHVSFVNPKNTDVAKIIDTTTKTSGTRYAQYLTAFIDNAASVAITTLPAISYGIAGAKCGQSTADGDASDIPCLQSYNVGLNANVSPTGDAGFNVKNAWIIYDGQHNGATGTAYAGYAQNNERFVDSIAYTHWDNPHQWASGTNEAGTSNQYKRLFCDGDGFSKGDTGNMVEDNGTHLTQYVIDFNGCGQLDTDEGTSTGFNAVNNTSYLAYGFSPGNTNVQYSSFVFKNNLLVLPYDPTLQEGNFQTGFITQAAMPSQNAGTLDYNGFYLMPGSGDSDAGVNATACAGGSPIVPCPIANAALGTSGSYVGVSVNNRVAQTTSTSGSSSTEIDCSTCNFTTSGVIAGDFVVDESSSTKAASTVVSVSSSTKLIINTLSSMTTGRLFTVRINYFSLTVCGSGCFYGVTSGYGTHDIHASPHFYDPTRGNCNYYVKILGGTAHCDWRAVTGGKGNYFTSTSISSTTTINDTSTNFVTIGITTSDWVTIYQGASASWRCTVQVSSVSATQITFPTCTGLTSGDAFSFITATHNLGRMIVTLNGWDYTGTPTTPIAGAVVTLANQWMRAGFRPQNFIYRGAGDDGSDLGAIPFTNNNIRSFSQGW